MDLEPVTVDIQEGSVIIRIAGHFNRSIRSQFYNAYQNQPGHYVFTVDFSLVETIDSTAVGMLLLLREHAGGESARIFFTNCNEYLKIFLTSTGLIVSEQISERIYPSFNVLDSVSLITKS